MVPSRFIFIVSVFRRPNFSGEKNRLHYHLPPPPLTGQLNAFHRAFWAVIKDCNIWDHKENRNTTIPIVNFIPPYTFWRLNDQVIIFLLTLCVFATHCSITTALFSVHYNNCGLSVMVFSLKKRKMCTVVFLYGGSYVSFLWALGTLIISITALNPVEIGNQSTSAQKNIIQVPANLS